MHIVVDCVSDNDTTDHRYIFQEVWSKGIIGIWAYNCYSLIWNHFCELEQPQLF